MSVNIVQRGFPFFIFVGLIFGYSAVQAGDLSGQKAPACQLETLKDGKPQPLELKPGHVIYIDFWASWCGPCRQSFPFMNKLHKDLGGRGLDVVGINVDEKTEDAQGFLEETPGHFTLLKDQGGRCATLFDVKAMPSTYLIDQKGVVRRVHLGFKPSESQEMRKQVEDLLGKAP